jgi:hypothetical protein
MALLFSWVRWRFGVHFHAEQLKATVEGLRDFGLNGRVYGYDFTHILLKHCRGQALAITIIARRRIFFVTAILKEFENLTKLV